MLFSEGLIKVNNFLRNIAWESRFLISGSNLFHSLILKVKKEFACPDDTNVSFKSAEIFESSEPSNFHIYWIKYKFIYKLHCNTFSLEYLLFLWYFISTIIRNSQFSSDKNLKTFLIKLLIHICLKGAFFCFSEYLIIYNQSQKFWDNSIKHNWLGFPSKILKIAPLKRPSPYANVVGQ